MPKLEITTQERAAHRAAAHPLRPVVMIGDKGLTAPVLKEIDLNLTAHQLIKVRINGHERPERETMLDEICAELSCAPVHHLGKTLILYRPNLELQQAAALARNATRAQRKPDQPYTPKKQAAQGRTRSRKDEISQRAARKSVRQPAEAPAAARPSLRPASPAPTAGHRIPRRAGSALTLRARARSR